MGLNAFLHIPSIPGESTDVHHANEIVVLTWSWGVSSVGTSGGGGGGASKPRMSEFTFTHIYDKASPLLAKACAQGKRIGPAVLTVRHPQQAGQQFLVVTLDDVVVTSVADAGDVAAVTESVSMTCTAISFAYRPQDAKGALGPPVTLDWNVKTGKVS